MQTYILVFPRIGRNRELKKVLEGYWKGELSEGQLRNTVNELKNGIGRFSMAQGFPSSLWAIFLSAIMFLLKTSSPSLKGSGKLRTIYPSTNCASALNAVLHPRKKETC